MKVGRFPVPAAALICFAPAEQSGEEEIGAQAPDQGEDKETGRDQTVHQGDQGELAEGATGWKIPLSVMAAAPGIPNLLVLVRVKGLGLGYLWQHLQTQIFHFARPEAFGSLLPPQKLEGRRSAFLPAGRSRSSRLFCSEVLGSTSAAVRPVRLVRLSPFPASLNGDSEAHIYRLLVITFTALSFYFERSASDGMPFL